LRRKLEHRCFLTLQQISQQALPVIGCGTYVEGNVGLWQILLQKSFCTDDQKFSGP
jgi:hypothetical protein